MRTRVLATWLILVPAVPLVAQSTPVRNLAKPDAEYAEPFIRIGSVHELKDGRVIVGEIHLRDGSLKVVDFAKGTATAVTRKGAGPGEFDGRPARLLTYSGDTTIMYDGGNARFLLLSPDSKPARTEPFKPTAWTFDLAWGDARGHVYAGLSPRMVTPNAQADSAPIIRLTVASGQLDTVAIRRASQADHTSFSDGKVGGFRTEEIPFANHDDWAAFPDGRLAVVRGKDYHIDFYRPDGTKYSGPPTKFVPVPVADADKDSVRKARAPKPGPDGKITLPKVPLILEPSVWFPTKAPFGENSVWAGPDGQLWVAIAVKAGDTAPKFDVFDAAGARVATIGLPGGSRVIGFGAHAIYVIRTDADDQQFLQRFDLPKLSATRPRG